MRLTNVALMSLPRGAVRSLAVPSVGSPGARIPVSFDQRRHVAQGQRPGSWMAIAFRLRDDIDEQALTQAWLAVLARHGTFRTVFTASEDDLHLNEATLGAPVWTDHPLDADETTQDAVRAIFDEACRPFNQPSYRLVVVSPDDGGARTVVIGSDHSHVDMWSLMVVVRDLVACLDDAAAGREPGRGLDPAATFAEHTRVLAAMPPVPEHVTHRWREILEAENGVMPLFPLPLGDLSTSHPAIVTVRDVLDAGGVAGLDAAADARRVRVISLAMSVITRVTREMSGRPLRAVFPVHSRHEPRWHDAVGWFITNAVIECADDDPKACAHAVKEAVTLGSYPLAPILAPYGGMPEAPGMFALSWLDGRRLPVQLDDELEIQHVSAVIRTTGVMIWFIVTPEGLHLRCRYPDTPEARESVGEWLDRVVAGLREIAAVAPVRA